MAVLVKEIITSENLEVVKICDLGGTYRYWLVFPFHEFSNVNFEITLINLEERLFAESLEIPNASFFSKIGDACNMADTKDNEYHLCHSNSVIEHVGNWSKIKDFRKEHIRIGKYYYIQTPNYWFPIEPHYFLPLVHFFPRPIHTRLLMLLKKKNFDRATSNFEDNRMLSKREFRFLFPDARWKTERFFLLAKSFIATSKI